MRAPYSQLREPADDDPDVHAPGRGIAFGVAVSLLMWAPAIAAVLGLIGVLAR